MHITRLHLEHFARHTALDVEFAPGLNVVRGANEAGKSTIQRALEMVLFRRPTSVSDDLERLRSWGDAAADPVIEMEFEDEETKGTLRKTFAGQRGTVELQAGDETLTDPTAVEQQVVRLTGLPSEKFFRATASIHHQELGGLTQDESTLRDRLQQSMSGADRGTHAARRKLEEAIRRYRTEGPKNPGYLKVMRAEVDRLRDAVRRGEAALAELEADRRTLAQARAVRVDLDARLAEQRKGAEKAERAAALTTRAADAARRYALYRRATELREEIGKLDASHPSAIALPTLRSTVEHLRSLEYKLSEMRAELAAEPDLSGYDVSIPHPRWRPWMAGGGALLVGSLAVALIGIVAGATVPGMVLGVLIAALGAVCLLVAYQRRRRISDIRLQNELRESEIARRLAGRTELAEKVRQVEQERSEALASLGSRDLTVAESTLAAETDLTAKIGARKAEYRGLMGDEPAAEDVGALRDKAAAEVDECRHTLAGIGEIGRDPEKYVAAYQLAIQRLGPEREAALQAEAQADARVSANGTDAEQVAADAEALQAADETLAAAERRVRIYEDVLATLNAAERGTMKKAARYLEQRMARDVERITAGRYRRLKVDESNLTFTVYSPELNAWTDVRLLSQGTLDQLYLCARLGIIRQVTSPATPPLVFDDPFVTFDDERAARALALLKEISRDYQVIFLTTADRYDGQADRVVVLPTPEERDVPESAVVPSGPVETISMWSSSTLPSGNENGHNAPVVEPAQPGASSSTPVEHAPLWPEDR
jgi:DNA repair exonuclease SbcCD ATPase subunit